MRSNTMNKILQKLASRRLPDLFAVGAIHISSLEEWETAAKPYWRELLLREEYGKFPQKIEPQIAVLQNKDKIDFAGKAIWETVLFTFVRSGKEHTVPSQFIFPKKSLLSPCPVFIYLNFRPDIPDRYLPVEEIIDRGFGIFTVCYNDITQDNADFSEGLAGLFSDGERGEDEREK